MDVVDRSFKEETKRIEAMIQQSRNYRSSLRPIGQCHSCDEALDATKLYCDNVCAEDHHKHLVRRNQRH